jgi:glycosyltransferase involved in cell wall biosynthesis
MNQRGDAPALITAVQAGICLPAGRPRELAGAILALSRNAALCRRLGANGRHYAEVNLSPAAVAGQYERLMIEVIEMAREREGV